MKIFLLILLLLPLQINNAETITNSSDGEMSGKIIDKQSTFKGWYSGEERHAETRKNMLQIHPLLGMTTWLLWLATNLEGEKALDHLNPDMNTAADILLLSNPSQNFPLYLSLINNNPNYLLLSKNRPLMNQQLPIFCFLRRSSEWSSGSYGERHKKLAMMTTAAYALTAGMALLAPSGYEVDRSKNFDSIFFHKGLALVHFAAMASMPSLGRKIEHEGPDAAREMQNVAWTGFGALTVSMFVVYF